MKLAKIIKLIASWGMAPITLATGMYVPGDNDHAMPLWVAILIVLIEFMIFAMLIAGFLSLIR